MRKGSLAVAAAVAYAAAIFVGSSITQPLQYIPPELLASDKLVHAAEYAVLGALVAAAFRLRGRSARNALAWAVAIASAYGISDEVHQYFVPGRSADPFDWMADTLGAAVGAMAALAVLRRWGPRASIDP